MGQVADIDQTQIVTLARDIDLVAGDRLHCLEYSLSADSEERHVIGPLGLKIGRTSPADIVIADSEVSRGHCMVTIVGEDVVVADLGSTNGTYVDGTRVTAPTVLPVGSVLQVGNRSIKHEWRTSSEIKQSDDFNRELKMAASYVRALLPEPVTDQSIRARWTYLPSAKLGGDAFGYGHLRDELFVCYLVDVAGHGAGAAMHAVAIMNQLRQHALPNTDMADPAAVLRRLNELFQMDEHAGLYFTIWYGVYDGATRRLEYASGGHHASYLVSRDRSEAMPLRTRNTLIGAMPGIQYKSDSLIVPNGHRLFIFSDGVYEIIDKDGKQWGIADFVALLQNGPEDHAEETNRLYREVCARARPDTLDDDFSLVMLTFD